MRTPLIVLGVLVLLLLMVQGINQVPYAPYPQQYNSLPQQYSQPGAPPRPQQPRALSPPTGEDLECLTRTVYWESKNESILGQQLVAYVTVLRSRMGTFGGPSLCGVARKPGEYTSVAQWGRSVNSTQYELARAIARQALEHAEPPHPCFLGILFFRNVPMSARGSDRVFNKFEVAGTVGNHTFYRRPGEFQVPAGCQRLQTASLP
jgi:spore germination cell wall hydrolase CwlJ-like protein